MKPIFYSRTARQQLPHIVAWYDDQRAGPGGEFHAEYVGALAEIQQRPTTWPRVSSLTRRFLLKRFPYGIFYQVRRDHIRVLSGVHLHRRPKYGPDH